MAAANIDDDLHLNEMFAANNFAVQTEGDKDESSDMNTESDYSEEENKQLQQNDIDDMDDDDDDDDQPQSHHSNINNNNNNVISNSSDDNDPISSDSSLSDINDNNQAIELIKKRKENNKSNIIQNRLNKMNGYRYLTSYNKPNQIEQITDIIAGQHAVIDKLINPYTLTYIPNELEDKNAYPQWINYKYNSYNTSYMLMLSVIIMILSTIHISFTTDTTLLLFTICILSLMIILYLIKVILDKRNVKYALAVFAIAAIIVLISMCIYCWLYISKNMGIISIAVGLVLTIISLGLIYNLVHNANTVDCYVLCVACSCLYIIIQHTIVANLTTDKFLIYFSFLLFFSTLAGYIPFKHFCVLSIILWILYNILAIGRFMEYITIGVDDTNDDVDVLNTLNGNSIEYDIQFEGYITGYQLIFSNIILFILFAMLSVILYHKEKNNRYEYLDLIRITKQYEMDMQTKNINYHNGNGVYNNPLPKINELDGPIASDDDDDDDNSISALSNERRSSDHDLCIKYSYLDNAINALPQPIYRLHLQSDDDDNILHGYDKTGIVSRQQSSIYNPNTHNNQNKIITLNRNKSSEILYKSAKKLIGDNTSGSGSGLIDTQSSMDRIFNQGLLRKSPFNKLGLFFGHMSQCDRPQYITRNQQYLLKKQALETDDNEFDGLSSMEKINAKESKRNSINKRYDHKHALWPIIDLPEWYMIYTYILHGYRCNISFGNALSSLFWKHNELMNVYSDYILFLCEVIWLFYMCYYEETFFISQKLETQIIVIGCLSISILRGFISGSTHLFHCMNSEISRKLWNIDFIFILLFQCVLTIIWIHFIFYCDIYRQILFYFCSIILSFTSILTNYFSMQPLLKDISIFFTIIFNYLFLYIYVVIIIGMNPDDIYIPWNIVFYWFCAMCSLIIGCLFKYFKFPENIVIDTLFLRKNKNKIINLKENKIKGRNIEVDAKLFEISNKMSYQSKNTFIYYFGNSHNIYHIFIHGLLLINMYAFREYLNWRTDNQC